jgi:hypothetical protein
MPACSCNKKKTDWTQNHHTLEHDILVETGPTRKGSCMLLPTQIRSEQQQDVSHAQAQLIWRNEVGD